MGFFSLFDSERQSQKADLKKLGPFLGRRMDQWIRDYENDGTPPNEDEAREQEDEHIVSLMAVFDDKIPSFTKCQDKVPERRALLEKKLTQRKGKLFAKFSDQVEALEDAAANMMAFCLAEFTELEVEMNEEMPLLEGEVEKEFDEFLDQTCTEYINSMFPGGVEGMDAYDNEFPEGLIPFPEFKAMVAEKKDLYVAKNQEAIVLGIAKVKEDTTEMAKTKINEAVRTAMAAIELDLSDDVLPYLAEDAMEELRVELIGTANEYGNGRLEE